MVGSGPAARFDWNLKNKDLNELREVKEASGRVSHPELHMLGIDKRNRKPLGPVLVQPQRVRAGPCPAWLCAQLHFR